MTIISGKLEGDYTFWVGQLAGENPECEPGNPGCGFYRQDRRVTYDDPVVGKRRKRVELIPEVVAIWKDGGVLTMRTDSAKGETRVTTELLVIEPTFARACRNAISFDDYLKGPNI